MRSPATALAWEIWYRNRGWIALVIGMILTGRLLMAISDQYHGLATMLFLTSFLLAFGIFDYSEVIPQRSTAGFPRRLFTLPVSSLLLVTVPSLLGIAFLVLVRFAWTVFNGFEVNALNTAKLIAFVVLYQSILWVLAAFGVGRVIVLGIVAIWLIAFGFSPLALPAAQQWSLDKVRIAELGVVTIATFLVSWAYIARQRSGGGSRRTGRKALTDRLADRLPARTKRFSSPAAAQFWFEWRRAGRVLPLYVGVLLVAVVGPLAMAMRDESDITMRVLVATLAMPMVLSLPVGKGFSKPDFWSKDMLLAPFVAVRPLTTDDLVMIKIKVAALSASISWLVVLAFLAIWIPLEANVDLLRRLWMRLSVAAGSEYAAYAILVLSILAGLFLTWRFLVEGLWVGLSGNRKVYASSALPYGVLPVAALIGLVLIADKEQSIWIWMFKNREEFLTDSLWIAGAVVAAKFCLSVFVWRRIAARQRWRYGWVWACGTGCLITLAMLVWSGLRSVLPPDVARLRDLLILIALSIMPLARLGLAPLALARNRHR